MTELTNGPQPDYYRKIVARIENVYEHLDQISDEAKEKKKPWQQDMTDIYLEADDAGIDVKALKAAIRRRRHALKAKRIYENLDLAERSNVVSIEAALGPFIDTPLGQAAHFSALEIRGERV